MYRVIFMKRPKRIWQAMPGQKSGRRVIGTPLISLTNILPQLPCSHRLWRDYADGRQCAGANRGGDERLYSQVMVSIRPSTYRSLTRSFAAQQ